MLRYFYHIFTIMIAVLPCCKRTKIKTFGGICLLTQIGGLTTLPRRPVATLRAFGTSVFCFAKIWCAHIFSVLSPDVVIFYVLMFFACSFCSSLLYFLNILMFYFLMFYRPDNEWCAITLAHIHASQYLLKCAIVVCAKLYMTS